MRIIAAAVTGLALTLTLAACGSAAHSSMSGSPTTVATYAASTAEVSFAQLMIPHHQQAVQMADIALERTTNPDVTALAKEIKAAQDTEIAQMRTLLATWGAPEQMAAASTDSHGGMDHSGMGMGGLTMDGMMTAEQMAELGNSSGSAFDRMWLEMMIEHHEGAIAMAQQVLDAKPSDATVSTLAKAIVAAQQKEIATMQGLLKA